MPRARRERLPLGAAIAAAALTAIGASLVALPVRAAAPPPAAASPALAEARRHFQRAVALYNDGDFNAALAEFEASYRAYPGPSLLYNIGVTQKALFRYPEAIASLERYLAEAKSLPVERVQEVREAIAEMRALLGELTLRVTPEGAAVIVDGRSAGTTPLAPLALTAGRHVLELGAADHEPLRKEITVVAGEPLTLEIQLKPVPKTGQARITAAPPLASIRVDDRLVGTGSVELELGAGGHTLEVSAPGYRSERSELVIAAGQRRAVNVQLQALVTKPPLYRRWWLWTAVGAVAGGTATAIAVPLSDRRQPPLTGFSFGTGRVD